MASQASRSVLVTGRVLRQGRTGPQPAGIPGVAVTDGVTIAQTDTDGRYQLRVDPSRRHTTIVSLTVPAGWQAPRGENGTPRFFRYVDTSEADGGAPTGHQLDFVLRPDPAARQEEYRFAALTDVHVQPGAINTKEGFGHQLEQINALAREIEQGADPPRFITVAGDLTNDATWPEFRDYLAATAAADVPVWSAPGNHDLTNRVPGGPYPRPVPDLGYRDVIDGYRRTVGPEWYSFQYGSHHFVVLENYRGLAEADQLAWLEQDLALHGAGKQVVVLTHVPWNVPQIPGPDQTRGYLDLLGRYDVRLLLAGHTHANDVAARVVGDAVQAVTTSSASSSDQTPRGFRLVEFRDGGVWAPFAEFDTHREPRIVHPVGTVPWTPSHVHVNRYHPPGVATEVEYRVPPGDWHPMGSTGRHSWAGKLDPGAVRPDQLHQLRVRVRDHAREVWSEHATTFTVPSAVSDQTPRQGTPWPMFHADAQHSGRGIDGVGGLAPPLRLAWRRHTGGTIVGSSAALAQNTVVIGVRDEDGPTGNGVIALDLVTGARRWWTPTPGAVEASVAIVDDLVLAPAVRGPLHALSLSDGAVRWRWQPDHAGAPECWMYFAPTVVDRTVYQAYSVSSGTWVVAAEVETGHPRWHTTEPIGRDWPSQAAPAVDGDLLVFATAYANLVALDATSGAIRWQHALGAGLPVRAKPVLVDGVALLACQGDRLMAVDAESGTLRWSYTAEGASLASGVPTAATPAVADGCVYAGFTDGSVAALDLRTGRQRWRYQASASVASSPAVSGDHVYVGAEDGLLRALHRADGRCRWAHDLGVRVLSSPALTGNTLVIGAWDGNVSAFTGTAFTGTASTGATSTGATSRL